jgi:hypothetical protein
MNLSPTRREADRFAALLEHDRPTPADDPELAALAALAEALAEVAPPSAPRPEFRTALRQRLVAVATVQPPGTVAAEPADDRTPAWRTRRRLAAVAGGAAALTAVAGVGLGASRSLPGDPLYAVKQVAEQTQLELTHGTAARGERHLEFARTRLEEVRALTARHAPSTTIVATLHAMDDETRAGADDLLSVAARSGSTGPLHSLDAFTRTQFAQLRAALPALPVRARAAGRSSLALLDLVAHRTVALSAAATSSQAHRPAVPSPAGVPGRQDRRHARDRHAGSAVPAGVSAPPATGPSTAPTTAPSPLTGTAPSTSGTGTGSTPLPGLPTGVPTIPPLPTSLPDPVDVPTAVPTLPSVSDLLP